MKAIWGDFQFSSNLSTSSNPSRLEQLYQFNPNVTNLSLNFGNANSTSSSNSMANSIHIPVTTPPILPSNSSDEQEEFNLHLSLSDQSFYLSLLDQQNTSSPSKRREFDRDLSALSITGRHRNGVELVDSDES